MSDLQAIIDEAIRHDLRDDVSVDLCDVCHVHVGVRFFDSVWVCPQCAHLCRCALESEKCR